MGLRPQQPHRPHGALQIPPDLQIPGQWSQSGQIVTRGNIISSPQTLEIGQEADLRLGGYSPELEAAQVLVTIEHILSGHSSQHQVNQTLAPVTVNWV